MIRVRTPFRIDKNLGLAYNEEFALCPDGDWLCLIDHDVLFLTPDAVNIMELYVEKYPDTGLFTCFTNRIHPLAINQLVDGVPSDNDCIGYWQERAYNQKRLLPQVTPIGHEVSGFLMLISKAVWQSVGGFLDTGVALGVDNKFSWRLLHAGKSIARMDALLVWHSYRLKDIKDKSHLH